MLAIIGLLLPLFSLIVLGWIVGKLGVAKANWVKVLNLFGYYIAFPALIFKSLAFVQLSWVVNSSLIFLHLVIGIVTILSVFAITRLFGFNRVTQNTIGLTSYFSNAGYIGIAALQTVFGDEAAAEGAVIVAVMIFVSLTLGVGLLEASRSRHVHINKILGSIIRTPLMWAAVIGMTIGLAHWPLPNVIKDIISLVASSATPTVMVGLGIFLANSVIHLPTLRKAIGITIIKMILLPGICGVVIWLVPHSNNWLNTTFIQLAMPVAITNFALAEVYPMDKAVVSTAIVISTLSGFLIIPLVMWLTTTF